MYVSMNPKGETGKVIHISQNDTNREVEFIPFDQNGLTPLTDGQLTARINSIKGNTVSFNQLIDYSQIISSYTTSDVSFAKTGNSFVVNGKSTSGDATMFLNSSGSSPTSIWSVISGHKYYLKGCPSGSDNGSNFYLSWALSGRDVGEGVISTASSTTNIYIYIRLIENYQATNITFIPQMFDLTLMGIDSLTTAQVEEWLSSHIGDLPYLDYTQGTLIPFMGTGLKTTGKNLWLPFSYTFPFTNNGITMSDNGDGTYTLNGTVTGNNAFFVIFDVDLSSASYYVSLFNEVVSNGVHLAIQASDNSYPVDMRTNEINRKYNNTFDVHNLIVYINTDTVLNNFVIKPYIGLVDANEFEPYTSNTLSLPTQTYFPSGMKSAGSVYDELSDKAYTRIESVDLGSLTWTYENNGRFSAQLNDVSIHTLSARQADGMECSDYVASTSGENMTFFKYKDTGWTYPRLYFYNTSYSDATAFKNSLSNVYLYYEKATPTETDISLDLTYPIWNGGTEQILPINGSTPTTAPIKANITYPDRTEDTEFLYKQTSFEWIYKSWAFACKNITQALSVVGNALKGTIPGTMTSESGKFPLKVKMTDNDGVCFSEKIDLFVERKP